MSQKYNEQDRKSVYEVQVKCCDRFYDGPFHTCDTFLSPNRGVWNFWSGNSCQISGGFHVANFGLFYRSLKVAKSSDNS